MDKKALRQKTIKKLKKLTTYDKQNIEKQLAENLMNSDLWKQSSVVGLTVSKDFEWSTKRLIETAWEQEKEVALPKCYAEDRLLKYYVVHSFNQLENVYTDLLEPIKTETKEIHKNQIDLLVVPGLLFDREGYRIGFGGGYYDRFLTDFTNIKVSLCSNDQVVHKLPISSYDVPVDYLVTETGFKNNVYNKRRV